MTEQYIQTDRKDHGLTGLKKTERPDFLETDRQTRRGLTLLTGVKVVEWQEGATPPTPLNFANHGT
jgi:hypothetical protein